MAKRTEPYVFSDAVREFWHTRERQGAKQRELGGTDQRARSEVTGGQQMAGFARTIIALLTDAGVNSTSIYATSHAAQLPGYFRPAKRWDLLVVENGSLRAAIELKSHVGSFGNNFNNRTEEALGTAVDTWTAYREGAFGTSPQPWLGYFLLLQDSPESHKPGTERTAPHFPVFDEFRGASYARRYELFCRRLVLERQYSGACFITADRDRAQLRENYAEPADDLAAHQFLTQLIHYATVPLP